MHLPESSTFEQAPAGTHNAICIGFIDLGTQPNDYNGETKMQHQVVIRWELPDELMEDGKPFIVSRFYTWSMNDRAVLRLHLEAWRGKPFEKADFGDGGFNTRNLLGKPCTLGVVHSEKGKAKVSSVGPKMKGAPDKTQTNPSVYLALTPEDFEPSTLANIGDWFQEKVKASPEYRRIASIAAGGGEDFTADLDDEIPFVTNRSIW